MIKNNGCCDLKYAKKLRELKVKQESLWYWWINKLSLKSIPTINSYGNDKPKKDWVVISAFTVAELGEMLPKGYFTYKASNLPHYQCAKYTSDGHVDRTTFYCNLSDKTEANVRAKMLIWLIENNRY